jgi:phospholipase C
VAEKKRFGRRTLLGGAAATGAALVASGWPGPGGPASAIGSARAARSLRRPDSLPHPHLPAGTDTLPAIGHVVILMMENHSFDDHFGRLGRGDGLTVSRDGAPLNDNPGPDGDFILSFPMPNTAIPKNSKISQSWNASHLCWDHGTNMGFARTCGAASMGHFTGAQLPFYYSLARQFPIGDRYFSSVMAQTYPNRRFLIAATALGDVATDATGISAKDAPNGTIFDRLDSHGITWRDYYDVPTAALFLPEYSDNLHDGRLAPINQFLSDAAAGQLPQVSLVDPYTNYSEENGDISIGEAYAARIIGAVLESPNWSRTAMFLVYDEHGGWYDHVPPQPAVRPDDVPPEITVPPDQPGAYDYTGFRVPCVVISPFAKRNFVSHVVHEHTSLLKFVESNAPDMTEFFSFAGTPPFRHPPALAAPLNPFLGALPATSKSPGFHPVATPVDANTLPPAEYGMRRPPHA